MTGYYTGGYTVTENGSAYDHGHAAGQIAGQLTALSARVGEMSATLSRLADAQASLVLQLQRLEDAAAADRETVLATARALKDADETRQAASERRWSPLARLGAAVGALAALAGIIFGIWSAVTGK